MLPVVAVAVEAVASVGAVVSVGVLGPSARSLEPT